MIIQTSHREARSLGTDQNIYIANDTEKPIYVMVGLHPAWVIADVLVDIGLLVVGLGELRGLTIAASLPETVNTFKDVIKLLRVAAALLSAAFTTGARPGEALEEIFEWFRTHSLTINPGQFVDVSHASFMKTYFSASGIAGLANAPTMHIVVVSDEGRRMANWTSGPDMSWIAKEDKIVRTLYGRIWVHDPHGRTIRFQKAEKGVALLTRRGEPAGITVVNGLEIPWAVKWNDF